MVAASIAVNHGIIWTWVDIFRRTWNNGIRRVFTLPYRMHTRCLDMLIERPYVTNEMLKLFHKMILFVLVNENDRLNIYHKE